MPGSKPNGVDRRLRRRWSFAQCSFDEANWTLVVDGRRVAVESKPLELLRELLIADGNLVSKEDLLDRIWPDLHVVEASLPTAVRKLRLALGDDERDEPIIETAQRIGYRIAVPIELGEEPPPEASAFLAPLSAAAEAGRRVKVPALLSVSGALAITVAAVTWAVFPSQQAPATKLTPHYTQRDAANALRKLDIAAVERLVAAGWDPNTSFDNQGNGAINMVLNICEWDPGHDKRKLQLMVRTLMDSGGQIDRRNVWGDTPYSIAKAKRYCGPDHPVTKMLRTLCYAGYKPPGDKCLASYELKRRQQRRA